MVCGETHLNSICGLVGTMEGKLPMTYMHIPKLLVYDFFDGLIFSAVRDECSNVNFHRRVGNSYLCIATLYGNSQFTRYI